MIFLVILKSDGKPAPSEVEPIKDKRDIQKIKQYLLGGSSKRDYALFVFGINVGLRASDLLNLRINDVAEHSSKGKWVIKDSVLLVEQKTSRKRDFQINQAAQKALELYLNEERKNAQEDEYLFLSQKGTNCPLQVNSLHKIIKTLMRELNIKGNYGTHTLRKTFAYHIYANNIKDDPGIVEKLQKLLNHSSASITLRYIGITREVINDIYNSLNL